MELPKLDFKINLALLAIAYFPILIKPTHLSKATHTIIEVFKTGKWDCVAIGHVAEWKFFLDLFFKVF